MRKILGHWWKLVVCYYVTLLQIYYICLWMNSINKFWRGILRIKICHNITSIGILFIKWVNANHVKILTATLNCTNSCQILPKFWWELYKEFQLFIPNTVLVGGTTIYQDDASIFQKKGKWSGYCPCRRDYNLPRRWVYFSKKGEVIWICAIQLECS